MKRVLSLLLSLMLLVTLMPKIAMADNEKKSGDFTYRIKGNGTAAITGYDWASHSSAADIYIPRMLDGYAVTEIAAEAFATLGTTGNGTPNYSAAVGSIVIPDTITTIGDFAFFGVNLKAKSLSIPNSVQHIGVGTFSNINGLESFSVATGNPVYATIDGVLFNKTTKTLVAYPLVKRIKEYSVPKGIITIGDYSFYAVDSYNTEKIVLPTSVTTIGEYAFAYAENVPAEFHKNISFIGEGAFCYASFLWKDVDLSNTQLTQISPKTFQGALLSDYSGIKLPNTLLTIGESAFCDIDIRTLGARRSIFVIEIPASVTVIDTNAFKASKPWSPTRIAICSLLFSDGSNLKTIGEDAFANLYIQGQLSLPNGLREIGKGAFSGVPLETIGIPSTVSSIGENFVDRTNVYIDTPVGSYASLYASENGYMMVSSGTEDTSWLGVEEFDEQYEKNKAQHVVIDAARALSNKETLSDNNTLTGTVISIDTPWSPDYQNITVTMVCDGRPDQPIQCYRLTGKDASGIAVGDIITVTGKLRNYYGTIEFIQGCTLDTIVKAQ